MAVYQRGSGGFAAERVRPVPGSEEAERYAALAADPASGWRCVDDEAPAIAPEPENPPGGGGEGSGSGPDDPKRPARSASKADWVAYAVAQGADQAEAEAKTRDQLAELFADEGGD